MSRVRKEKCQESCVRFLIGFSGLLRLGKCNYCLHLIGFTGFERYDLHQDCYAKQCSIHRNVSTLLHLRNGKFPPQLYICNLSPATMSPAKEHPQRRQPSLSQDIGFVHTTPSMARTSVELSRPLSPASEPHHASLSFPKSEGKPATATPSDSPTSGFPGYNSEEAYVDAKVKHSDWVYEHVLQHMDW